MKHIFEKEDGSGSSHFKSISERGWINETCWVAQCDEDTRHKLVYFNGSWEKSSINIQKTLGVLKTSLRNSATLATPTILWHASIQRPPPEVPLTVVRLDPTFAFWHGAGGTLAASLV